MFIDSLCPTHHDDLLLIHDLITNIDILIAYPGKLLIHSGDDTFNYIFTAPDLHAERCISRLPMACNAAEKILNIEIPGKGTSRSSSERSASTV
ncbi:MAG: hypothetical protein M3R08_05815 [Bacteroidota bacterium]|nr:hypothetical protein [Bacteroidota bacterium]